MQQDRLDEVVAKLKNQGIAEGRKDADAIIAKARDEAGSIVSNAKKEAEAIVADAKKDAEKTKKQLEAELKQAGQVGLEAFKQAVEKALVVPTLDESLKPMLSDPRFLEGIIVEMVKGFSASGMKQSSIDAVLPANNKEKLEQYLGLRVKNTAGKSVSLKFTDEISAGLRIGPSGNEFVIDLTGDGFREVFQSFISPRFRRLFFKSDKA